MTYPLYLILFFTTDPLGSLSHFESSVRRTVTVPAIFGAAGLIVFPRSSAFIARSDELDSNIGGNTCATYSRKYRYAEFSSRQWQSPKGDIALSYPLS